LADDLLDVLGAHAAVPDVVGIDHHRRPLLARVEAAGLVRADDLVEAERGELLLEGVAHRLAPAVAARGLGRALGPLVGADEDVALVGRRHVGEITRAPGSRHAAPAGALAARPAPDYHMWRYTGRHAPSPMAK